MEIKRPIDYTKPVQVYRNLHKKRWSIRQAGLVVAHATDVWLKDVNFKVSEKGRQRVVREKRKNVHAFICGMLHGGLTPNEQTHLVAPCPVTYNPYKFCHFVSEAWNGDFTVMQTAKWCHMNIGDHSTPKVIAFLGEKN